MRINRRQIIFFSAAILVIAFLFVVMFRIYTSNKAKLVVAVAPKDATVYIDSSRTKVGTSYISPGDHKIKISRDGFSSFETQVSTQKGKTTTIARVLITNSQVGVSYEASHTEEFTEMERIADEERTKNETAATKNYPLTSRLPIEMTPSFRIDYGRSVKYPDDPKKVAIFIAAPTPSDKQSAISYIFAVGFDPSDYEIVFKDLKYDANNPIGD